MNHPAVVVDKLETVQRIHWKCLPRSGHCRQAPTDRIQHSPRPNLAVSPTNIRNAGPFSFSELGEGKKMFPTSRNQDSKAPQGSYTVSDFLVLARGYVPPPPRSTAFSGGSPSGHQQLHREAKVTQEKFVIENGAVLIVVVLSDAPWEFCFSSQNFLRSRIDGQRVRSARPASPDHRSPTDSSGHLLESHLARVPQNDNFAGLKSFRNLGASFPRPPRRWEKN